MRAVHFRLTGVNATRRLMKKADNVPSDIFFTIAAHVPDRYNQDLLGATLTSIHTHHPTAPVLVVDNASPIGRVQQALARLSDEHRQCTALRVHGPVSHGMIGSWHEADAVLSALAAGKSRGWLPLLPDLPPCFASGLKPGSIDRIALLQHSTLVRRPLPVLPAACTVVALSGTAREHIGTGWLRRQSVPMRWASAKAQELYVPCSPRCAATQAPYPSSSARPRAAGGNEDVRASDCIRWDECDDWSAATHATLLLSRAGFRELSSYGLWPTLDARGNLAFGNSSFARRTWAVQHGEAALPHAGIEVLAGILTARINGWPASADRCACTDCLEKRHGGTGRIVEKVTVGAADVQAMVAKFSAG